MPKNTMRLSKGHTEERCAYAKDIPKNTMRLNDAKYVLKGFYHGLRKSQICADCECLKYEVF